MAKRIVSWRYKVDENGNLTTDDRPGKVVPYVDIGARGFFNFLTQNSEFFGLSSDQQTSSSRTDLPVQRTDRRTSLRRSGILDLGSQLLLDWMRGLNRQTFQPLS